MFVRSHDLFYRTIVKANIEKRTDDESMLLKVSSKIQRSSNFELLRILAMLAIIAGHFSSHGCSVTLSNNLIKVPFIKAAFLQALYFGAYFGVSIFILLSGYFLIKQPFRVTKFIKLLLQYLFYSILILLIAAKFHIVKVNYILIVTALFPLVGFNWFADAYILLYIFFPFLNRMILYLKKSELEFFIVTGAIIWYLIPTISVIFAMNINMFFSNAIMFIYLYCVGAYIRIFQNNNENAGKIAIGFYFAYIFLQVFCFRFGKSINWLNHGSVFLAPKNSLFILIVAVFCFLFFRSISLEKNSCINYISSTTFGIYLIHDNGCIRRYLWDNLVLAKSYYTQPHFVLYSIVVILSIFFVCSLFEFLRIKFFEKPLFDRFGNVIQEFEDSVRNHYKL